MAKGVKVAVIGSVFAVMVGGAVRTENAGSINGRFTLVDVSAQALSSSTMLEALGDQLAATEFARPEDGNWDPTNPRVFYFNVTGSIDHPVKARAASVMSFSV